MIKFNDGVNIDTSGPLRTLKLFDGLYVVGQGYSIPVADEEEASVWIKKLDDQIAEKTKRVVA